MSRRGIEAAVLAAALALAGGARAHEFRPALLDVTELGAGRFEVAWVAAPGASLVRPVFPPHCTREAAGSLSRRYFLDCGAQGLAGHSVRVSGLAPLRDEVLFRWHPVAGAEATAMLSAARPAFALPEVAAAGAPSATLASYVVTGAAHLLTGLDHVLFLLGLLLLVHRRGGTGHEPRKALAPLVRAVTAFTLAHSLTLALQVLGAVQLAPAPVEAAIALSILLLGRELLRPPSEPTLVQRRPWLAAFAFGLLHGLGFAGGLAALRLSPAQIPAALLGFNLGLEAAQLGLVAVALLLARALGAHVARWPSWTHRVPAYAIGTVATFWLLQRTSSF